jgi:hypothetical protein
MGSTSVFIVFDGFKVEFADSEIRQPLRKNLAKVRDARAIVNGDGAMIVQSHWFPVVNNDLISVSVQQNSGGKPSS